MDSKDKLYKKGRKYYEDKNFKDAIYWYSRALAEGGDDAELYSERAVAFFHNKQLKQSLEDMDRAQELEPQRAYRYASRAYIKDAMGDVQGAVADYEMAVKLDPEDAIAHNNLGMLQEKLGYHNKAKALYDFADNLAKNEGGESLRPESPPQNIQQEINREKRGQSVVQEVGKVFNSKKGFGEFLSFIRNGFK